MPSISTALLGCRVCKFARILIMPLRRRIAYPLVLVFFIAIVVFNTLRIANIGGLSEKNFDLFIADLNRQKIQSLQKSSLFENGTELMFFTNASHPIAFYNSSDFTWTPTKAAIVANLHLLRNHILSINEAQYIHNIDRFGKASPLFIIIIQVHQRYTHLLYLIESLRRVRGIEEALVVFSHDFFSPEINRMIAAIRFVRFTQIFFPYSRQIFLNSFPGPDPRDCHTRGAKNCLNHEWPDIAGNYRDARFAQVKHHWIWKLCFVINKMNISKSFNGQYILLEEDYIVLKDMLHVLSLAKKLNTSFDIIALGSYENLQTYNSSEILHETYWISSKHNMGMAFTKNLFQKLEPYWKNFCIYDDYNWDWSLYFIDRVCASEKLRVLHFKNCGRVFHTGSCGLHNKGSECDNVEASVVGVMERVARGGGSDEGLFPATLMVKMATVQRSAVPPNGGWGDARDRALCLAIVNNRWLPLAHFLPDDPNHRRLDAFEPLIPGVSDTAVSVL
ncbi:alpha 16 mannosyl glycoprotein [Echinococcus multilocularis]|uniref:Alpha-1,6-mannosyl-glycoprotein 2-beta-N-acetylglucosaminyltransferase n=1 Tax=Echinococcus multilocularis TaxID=6211 RepID=A0A068Y7C0_ECHMU|nr:alpha 16 mannosyl glycoprotein [Echinococcus multilocularis]